MLPVLVSEDLLMDTVVTDTDPVTTELDIQDMEATVDTDTDLDTMELDTVVTDLDTMVLDTDTDLDTTELDTEVTEDTTDQPTLSRLSDH